ncbi:ABC transporter permease [Agrococcus carbonis]|uniref:Transport permease protein n=1 Tax=Agrococcus carbonis TaxID=684552 RepID=A0A1H1MCB3_9MICO|nr:ABC transporter permease [Agrococcus carbonis]SDR84408.1 lipooligosaccharide transport system permease protein [Agrococcus carbonis]
MSIAAQRDRVADEGGVDHGAVARRARVWGWWFVAEHRIRAMRAYVASWVAIGVGSPFLFLLGLGLGLGLLVDANQGAQGVDGVPYLVFIAPALSMATAMQTAAQENTYGVFGGFKWFPMFFAMNGTPIGPAHIAVGFQVSVLVRVLLPLVAFSAVMIVFGIGTATGALLLIPIGLLLATAAGFAVMAWVSTQTEDRGQLSFVERFVVVPLTLFSGTYFPLETLPAFLHWIGWISPLWHAAELGRSALYGAELPPVMLLVHLGYLVLVALVACLLSIRTFRRRLDK